MATTRVCIIGAGASGIPSIRHAVLYGFDVVCYEAQNQIGGLWNYKPEETDESSVMKSTVINSSKELTAYSDYPPPANAANYMHNRQMYQYLKDYAKNYNLLQYIKMQHKVLDISRTEDYAKTGNWTVTVQDVSSGQTTKEVFNCVLLCTGHHTKPYWPEMWPGQENFKGRIMHAHSYKDHKGFEDHNVVVVGVGNSGGDVTVELSRIAKQVYLVSRRGTWVFNRIFDYGRPIDCALNTRFFETVKHKAPQAVTNTIARWQLNKRFDHDQYGLLPKHEVFSAHPTVNDELPNRIACGTVRVKPQIEAFTEHGVKFTDGTFVDNVDDVIVSTGYSFEFPWVEGGELLKVNDNHVDFYQYIFPLNLEHDTLAVIGLIQPYGSIMPISEMQSRVVFDVLSGRTKLPSKMERQAHEQLSKQTMAQRYVTSRRHTIQVDYIPYMDELSALIGCEPPTWYSLIATDPVLAFHLLLAPAASYIYRLRGPHQWKGARDAILGIEDRVAKATGNKNNGTLLSTQNSGTVLCFLIAAAAFFVLLRIYLFIF